VDMNNQSAALVERCRGLNRSAGAGPAS